MIIAILAVISGFTIASIAASPLNTAPANSFDAAQIAQFADLKATPSNRLRDCHKTVRFCCAYSLHAVRGFANVGPSGPGQNAGSLSSGCRGMDRRDPT